MILELVKALLRYANLIWLIPLWMFQYCWLVVVLGFKFFLALFKFGANVGVFGLMLLFLPVIGWIILAFWMLNRPSQPNYPSKSISLRPWCLDILSKKIKE